jgi:hypothetical protein
MSNSSKPKKVKPKGTVRELKLVQSVNRRGADTLKAEEVKTPRRGAGNATTATGSRHSSSPTKRRKLEVADEEPIPYYIEGCGASMKRQTLVCPYTL